MKRRILGLLVTFFVLHTPLIVNADEQQLSEDIVILYTNDVHTYIDGSLSYDVLAAIKDELETKYKYVILADAGDHIQGKAYGSMDKGESIIKLMNSAGYDVATLGNHEFDYGMERCLELVEKADYTYVSCNFHHLKDDERGENVLESYMSFDCGEETIAFVGITTPESIIKSTPAYFQNEEGKYIYDISGRKEEAELYQDVQEAVDAAKEEGATKVIVLGHLGEEQECIPWRSADVISNTTGLDAFIDAHSHSTIEGECFEDKSGNQVLVTQTGEYFDRIGMMLIDSETGEIITDFIECQEILGKDKETVIGYELVSDLYSGTELISVEAVKEIKDAWIAETDQRLGQVLGATDLIFDNYDTEDNRLVRCQETNTGDFCADALYYLFDDMDIDVDVAIMNGGGIRNRAITGELSYLSCKEMHTFGNVACLQTITGQQLLDALEWGARAVGVGEEGGFLQVSGLTYKIDTSCPDTTKKDDSDMWAGGPEGEYRVYDVKVYDKEKNAWVALQLDEQYNLAGYNYTLRDLGDGFNMFDGAINVLDYVMEDYMVLSNYISGFENGVVEAGNSPLLVKYPKLLIDYSQTDGSGRIEITEGKVSDREGSVAVTVCIIVLIVMGGAISYKFYATQRVKKSTSVKK